jgi:hypothetical protein
MVVKSLGRVTNKGFVLSLNAFTLNATSRQAQKWQCVKFKG